MLIRLSPYSPWLCVETASLFLLQQETAQVAVRLLARLLGMRGTVEELLAAPTLEDQRRIWNGTWVVRALRAAPPPLLSLVSDAAAVLLFNRFTLWFGGGIPLKQYQLIKGDGVHMSAYAARTFDGVAQHSHVAGGNYFYYNCLAGEFSPDNCPAYLTREGFARLKAGAVDALHVVNAFFLPTLRKRTYTRVILMDHVDWLDEGTAREVARALGQHVAPGGRVILRSAAFRPPYVKAIAAEGFEVRRIQGAEQGYMDRVNMYASFYLCIRKGGRK